jgi:SAM-dependent methyltransferase
MMGLHRPDLEEHNRRQRRYFEGSTKRTMVPRKSRYLRRQVNEALRVAGVRSGERVLEVGCGMGRYTLILATHGVRVEGLDLSPVLLDRLKGYNDGRYEIPLHCADIDDPPADLHASFDVVLGFFVLHHVYALDRCFQAATRLLKPGGRVVFLEPNPLNPLYYVQILITPTMTWKGEKGIVRMRPKAIFHAMDAAGLTRPMMLRFGFVPPFLANRKWGARVEAVLERLPIWNPFLPFQLFRADLA